MFLYVRTSRRSASHGSACEKKDLLCAYSTALGLRRISVPQQRLCRRPPAVGHRPPGCGPYLAAVAGWLPLPCRRPQLAAVACRPAGWTPPPAQAPRCLQTCLENLSTNGSTTMSTKTSTIMSTSMSTFIHQFQDSFGRVVKILAFPS